MSKAIGSVFAAGYSGDEFNDEEEKKKIRDRVQNYIRTAQPIDTESYLNNADGYLNVNRLNDIGKIRYLSGQTVLKITDRHQHRGVQIIEIPG